MKKVLTFLSCLLAWNGYAQPSFCTNNAARSWWDVQHYTIDAGIDTASGYLQGEVLLEAGITGPVGDSLQIDLQAPMKITAMEWQGVAPAVTLNWQQEGNAYYITDLGSIKNAKDFKLLIRFEGTPRIARMAPWDGGLVLERDNKGIRWIGMACQGDGASVWFPCKDFQGDEPDKGMQLTMKVPEGITMVGNGKCLAEGVQSGKGDAAWTWNVSNPINIYNITFYIGDYVHWTDTLPGEKGNLPLDYYVLRSNLKKAKKQFEVVKPMLHCFEEKLGPYPFYEDGYKLVEAPYLGMEHQSAIAYGNKYQMGYLGKDRSRTKAGLDFDYIIIHESGHEWFGNNITTYDKADTWVHEGLTTYTETIFEECLKGKKKAFKYQNGKRYIIRNDRPAQGAFGQCDEGSGDHYEKGAAMVHMIRMIMDNDTQFYAMLREMNARYYHKIVSGSEIETFISTYSGKDLSKIFDQYLRQSNIPRLEIKRKAAGLQYRWTDCIEGFNMPILLQLNGKKQWVYPLTSWQELQVKAKKVAVDNNFLVAY